MNKAKPILFSGPDVQATLAGRKTQTRRICKVTPPYTMSEREDGSPWPRDTTWAHGDPDNGFMPCPYGRPGDRLWVRETWAHYQTINHVRRGDGRSMSEVSDGLVGYRADGHDTINEFRRHITLINECDLEGVEIRGNRWQPSIHMPRWASRIMLEVQRVWVERVQDITEAGAIAEGCTGSDFEPKSEGGTIYAWRGRS